MSTDTYINGLGEAERLFVAGAFEGADKVLATALRARSPEALRPDRTNTHSPAAQEPVFSVIVDGQSCTPLLRDLAQQSVREFEVLCLCDTGAAGPDAEEMNGLPHWRSLTVPPGMLLAEARNLASLQAEGSILVFLDHACRVGPDLLEQVVRGFNDYDILALRGRLLPRSPSALNYRLDRFDNGDTPAASSLDVGAGFAVVRDVMLRFGGFGPLLTQTHGRDLAARIHAEFGQGAVAYLPGVAIRRDVAQSEEQFVAEEARARLEEQYLAVRQQNFCGSLADLGVQGMDPMARATSLFDLTPRHAQHPGNTPNAGRKEFELGLMLLTRGAFATLAEHFKDAVSVPFSCLHTAALLRQRRVEELHAALDGLPKTEEHLLKRRTAELLPRLDAIRTDMGLAPSVAEAGQTAAAPTGKEVAAASGDSASNTPAPKTMTSNTATSTTATSNAAGSNAAGSGTPVSSAPSAASDEGRQPRVHVLLLCWNRADYVREAVRQLARTDYRNWALYVADNGSTDNTRAELEAGLADLPEHVDVHVEHFPMNIGRPVGHDWLLTRHDHSAAEFIAVADDDLFSIPPGWLADMVATARLFPNAGVVGGKAYGEEDPRIIHGAVRDLLWYDRDDFVLSHGKDRVDYGQMDYIDFTDHVIGCLHIYRSEVLFGENAVGLFDIGLSPCQMVDVDHHLRCRLAGWQVVYNGLVEFGHARQGGKTAQATSARLGNVLGNQVKVLYKHEPEQVRDLLDRAAQEREKWLQTGEPPRI